MNPTLSINIFSSYLSRSRHKLKPVFIQECLKIGDLRKNLQIKLTSTCVEGLGITHLVSIMYSM